MSENVLTHLNHQESWPVPTANRAAP